MLSMKKEGEEETSVWKGLPCSRRDAFTYAYFSLYTFVVYRKCQNLSLPYHDRSYLVLLASSISKL